MKRSYLNRVSKVKKYRKSIWTPRVIPVKKKSIWTLTFADIQYSKMIREKYNYTCEKCGVKDIPPTRFIQCSHYIGRAEKMTRYYEDNTDVLCDTCHKEFEASKNGEYKKWKIEKLGKERHQELLNKRNEYLSERDSIINCMRLLGITKPII